MDRFDKFIDMCCGCSAVEGSCWGCKIFEKFCGSGYGSCQAWIRDHEKEAEQIFDEYQQTKNDSERGAIYAVEVYDTKAVKPKVGERVIVFGNVSWCEAKYVGENVFEMSFGTKLVDVHHWMRVPKMFE